MFHLIAYVWCTDHCTFTNNLTTIGYLFFNCCSKRNTNTINRGPFIKDQKSLVVQSNYEAPSSFAEAYPLTSRSACDLIEIFKNRSLSANVSLSSSFVLQGNTMWNETLMILQGKVPYWYFKISNSLYATRDLLVIKNEKSK